MMDWKVFSINRLLEEKIFLILCSGVALTVPLKASWNSLICILLILFWILFLNKKFNSKKILFALLLSCLFFLALFGLLYSSNIEEAFFRIQQKSILFVFPLIFSSVEFDLKKVVKVISTSLVISLFAVCILSLSASLFAWINSGDNLFFFGHALAEWLNLYPYIFALACLVAILFLIENLMNQSTLYSWLNGRTLCISLIIFFTLFIFLLSVKQVILSWVLVALFYSFRLMKKWWQGLVILSSIIIMLTTAIVIIPTLREKAMQFVQADQNFIQLDRDASLGRDWNGIALRRAIWTCSLDVINANFWMGVGTGDAHDVLQEKYEERKFYFASRYNRYNTHNQYLQTLVNFGFMGLLILLLSVATQLSLLKDHLIFVVFTICILSIFLTESMLETNKGVLVYSFFNSLIFFWKVGEIDDTKLNHLKLSNK